MTPQNKHYLDQMFETRKSSTKFFNFFYIFFLFSKTVWTAVVLPNPAPTTLTEQISRMVICRRVPSRRASIFPVLFGIEGPGIYEVLTTGKVIKPWWVNPMMYLSIQNLTGLESYIKPVFYQNHIGLIFFTVSWALAHSPNFKPNTHHGYSGQVHQIQFPGIRCPQDPRAGLYSKLVQDILMLMGLRSPFDC